MLLTAFIISGCFRFQKEPPAAMEVSNDVNDTEKTEAAEEDSAAEETVAIKEALISSVSEPRFAIIPPSARPGEPVTVAYGGAVKPALQAVLLDQRGRRVTKALFFRLDDEQGIVAAVLAVPSTALTGNALIRIEAGEDTVKELPFAINSREFQSETIALNQENTDLRTVPDPQKTAESEQLWAILSRTGKDIYSDCLFIPPVSSTRRTSFYGSRRVYEYADGKSDTTIHAGIDIGVPTGTGVLACAPGKVVLARSRIVTGNTVILEHLPGLYSLYYHMDSIAVAEGSLVEAQTFLGESGSTGLATGPHLHWEIRVSGENADPDAFLSSPVLDKNDILNKLN